jgi:hypothetical protein
MERREIIERMQDAEGSMRRADKHPGGDSNLPFGVGYSEAPGPALYCGRRESEAAFLSIFVRRGQLYADRLASQLGITVLLATAVSFAIPAFVDRPEYARAVSNYAKNPSSHNNEILRVESSKNQRTVLRTLIAATGLLCLILYAVWFLIGRWSGKSSESA